MKKIPNQKIIINEPHVENEDDNSKIARTNTFVLTKQTSFISYILRHYRKSNIRPRKFDFLVHVPGRVTFL
jgi:hypothetical protein